MASRYEEVIDAIMPVVAAVTGSTPVRKRKLPVDQEVLEVVPMICVVPSEQPESIEVISFENEVSVTYAVQIALVTANNANYDLANHVPLTWRQDIRRRFQTNGARATVTGWWMARVEMDTPIDRAAVSKNYDYSTMTILASVVEAST